MGGGGAALDETTHRKAGKPKLVRHVSLAVQGPGLAGDSDGVQQIRFGFVHLLKSERPIRYWDRTRQ